VQELTAALAAPQNLVSYHLRLLRRPGLVTERRSSADARDVYYRLEVARLRAGLGELGAGVHPALAAAGTGEVASGAVLFLCSANSARSQMAEAMLRQRTGGRVSARSAGTRPAAVHPLALQTLQGRGIPTDGLRSKHWSELGDGFDRVVSLCDIAREELPAELAGPALIHWSLPDPAAVSGPLRRRRQAFEATADEIAARIEDLLAAMTIGRAA